MKIMYLCACGIELGVIRYESDYSPFIYFWANNIEDVIAAVAPHEVVGCIQQHEVAIVGRDKEAVEVVPGACAGEKK